jgi:hypothetical protein
MSVAWHCHSRLSRLSSAAIRGSLRYKAEWVGRADGPARVCTKGIRAVGLLKFIRCERMVECYWYY